MNSCGKPMRGQCSSFGQIGTGTIRAALAGPAWALHGIVGWEVMHNAASQCSNASGGTPQILDFSLYIRIHQ